MRAARWMLVPLLTSGCVLSGMPQSPYGRQVRIEDSRERIEGELIAVSSDTVWVLQQWTLRAARLSEQRQIRVRRHDFGLRSTVQWLTIAGLGTGAALSTACGAYERSEGDGDGGCIVILPVTAALFATAALLFGAANEYTTVYRWSASDADRLRAFSRYPQGLPQAVRDSAVRLAPQRR